MNAHTQEWVQKAETDFASMQLLNQAAGQHLEDAVCFHAQQCVEKYLKGWLQEAAIAFPKIHDLEKLLDLTVPTVPAWNAWRPDLAALTTHAVDYRYPGVIATSAEAQQVVQVCTTVRTAVRAALGLPP